MAVKLLVCELVMAGRSTEWLGTIAELEAIQRVENREQVTVTQTQKINLHPAQRKQG